MSFPLPAVDRLFNRLLATYGAQFTRMYDGVNIADVKTAWAHELSSFGDRLIDIAWALEHLPERCPSAIEFRNLCRQAPEVEAPRLPEPKVDIVRVRAELARLQPLRDALAADAHGVDHKAWAKRIIARHESGERVPTISLDFARRALRMA